MEKNEIDKHINISEEKNVANPKKKKVISKEYREELLLAIERTQLELESVRVSFQFVSEPNLVDSLIYREREIISRYNYLIREMKLKKVRANKNEIYKKACKVC